jgi:hypothetical protein
MDVPTSRCTRCGLKVPTLSEAHEQWIYVQDETTGETTKLLCPGCQTSDERQAVVDWLRSAERGDRLRADGYRHVGGGHWARGV